MIRTLIVDDHALFAEALSELLERAGYEVIGTVGIGREAVSVVRRDAPDVVLLDLVHPDHEGAEVGRAILQQRPRTKVVVVTGRNDAQAMTDAGLAGFHGYVTRDAGVSHLLRSLERLADGRRVFQRGSDSRAQEDGPDGAPDEGRRQALWLWRSLTPREREILTHLVEGANTLEISETLHIAPNTVRSHVQALLSKLQVHSRLGAVALATRYGLLSGSER